MTQDNTPSESALKVTRRDFVKVTAAASVAALALGAGTARAAGSDKLRVGLVGMGRRGLGCAKDCVTSSPNVEIVAVGDLFKDNLEAGCKRLAEVLKDKYKATPETSFAGFDAYQKVIDCDVDLVLLCAPPGFRPLHLKAALEKGRHVFMEKPVAVDPAGVRSILASAEVAAQKKLGVVAGTQRRHQPTYVETMKRIHAGDIGEVAAGQVYWIGDFGYYPAVLRKEGWSDMEAQVRNWNYYTWLSGDHIVEQHVHNIDIMCWVMKGPPKKAIGMGGRQQRVEPEYGHIYDHFAVEFEFENGVRWASYCRQNANCAGRVSEYVEGTKGKSNCSGTIWGGKDWKYEGPQPNPYVQEHADLIASIRDGKPLNECKAVAESTLAAIAGRMSAYTGREVSIAWVLGTSKLDLTPPKYEFGPLAVPPVAIPGKTELI